jgi:aminoglycoside 3-N-acetyltransferase
MDLHLIEQLVHAGVVPGGVLVVHTALSRLGPIAGGPAGLIDALRAALGPDGTLVMPSMSDDDEHPFDRAVTPCRAMGVVADAFWRLPGVLRSDSPHAFAAAGPRAAAITGAHPIEVPHGLDSPIGRVFELDGQILLLGVGHDADTTVHLAETLAGVRYRLPKSAVIRRGAGTARVDYDEIDHCCERFALVDGWLDAEGLQQRGRVGTGEARVARARNVVRVVAARLAADETIFLHPVGVDAECDAARASLAPPAV